MQTMLVTGGAGFIGANFVRLICQARPDTRVTVLDKLTYAGNRANLAGLDIDLVEGDIADPATVEPLVAAADVVVHFAAESHNDNSLRDPSPFIHTNLVGTFTLLEACRKHDTRFHHVSTDEVFGDLEIGADTKFNETTAYAPSSPYSATKAGSDHLVRAWVRSFDCAPPSQTAPIITGRTSTLRSSSPPNHQYPLRTHAQALWHGRAGARLIHVDDHNEAVLAILERGRIGETYNIGADQEDINNKQVIELICEIMGHTRNGRALYEHVADRPGHDQRYAMGATKLRRELGWAPRFTDIRAGLEDTIAWYRDNEGWWKPEKENVEARYKQQGQ